MVIPACWNRHPQIITFTNQGLTFLKTRHDEQLVGAFNPFKKNMRKSNGIISPTSEVMPLPPMITAPSWLTDVFFWFRGICQDTKGSEVNLVKQCVKYGKKYLDLHHRKQETPKMQGWQMISPWKGVTFRFHICFFGSICNIYNWVVGFCLLSDCITKITILKHYVAANSSNGVI